MTPADKLAAAIAYLGKRHILHPEFDGQANHDPANTDVARTVKRYRKAQELERKALQDKLTSIINIRRTK